MASHLHDLHGCFSFVAGSSNLHCDHPNMGNSDNEVNTILTNEPNDHADSPSDIHDSSASILTDIPQSSIHQSPPHVPPLFAPPVPPVVPPVPPITPPFACPFAPPVPPVPAPPSIVPAIWANSQAL